MKPNGPLGSTELRVVFEQHQILWQLARPERRRLKLRHNFDHPFWDVITRTSYLAGCCTQVFANGRIHDEHVDGLLALPPITADGWREDMSRLPHVQAYLQSLELMRCILLRDLGLRT
jgi:hypothetical protein